MPGRDYLRFMGYRVVERGLVVTLFRLVFRRRWQVRIGRRAYLLREPHAEEAGQDG